MSRLLLVAALVLAVFGAAVAAAPPRASASGPFEAAVVTLLAQPPTDPGEGSRATRLAALEQALRQHADATQRPLRAFLAARRAAGLVDRITPLWISNEILVRAAPSVLRELAGRPDVKSVRPELSVSGPATPSPGATASPTGVEPNIARVAAPATWARGFRGQGIVVADVDTGVDATHPDLAGRWRGGSNSWYDPSGQHPTTPTDVNGHGTWTTGVMVGGSAGGTAVGVAPDATWIAAKVFNDRNVATTTNIHLALQWLLDPDGNPTTPDAPNVVNNSWTMAVTGCDSEFQNDLRSLRAAGILPVFAAGNDGPTAGSVFSPANLPEAFAVGGTDNSDALDQYSSRGPSACAGVAAPAITAPDTAIRTTDLYGGYAVATGTSLAAPHVAGALAVLLSAFPQLTTDQQESALENGSLDLGPAGLDPDTGYGRLDVDAAYNWAAASPDFSVLANPASATVSPGNAATFTASLTSRNGFAGDATLTATLPPGLAATATFDPAVVAGSSGSASVAITPSNAAAPGTYLVTIMASSGGLAHSTTVTVVVPGPPEFALTSTPAARSVVAGGTTSYDVAVSAVDGFTGTVGFTLDGLPASVGTATFTPTTVTAAGTTALTVTVPATAPPGAYHLTVRGASGSLVHTLAITLTVLPRPDFAVGVSPKSVTVAPGARATYTVNTTALNGFSSSVALSVAGVPAAVGTATMSPSAVTGSGTAQLAVATTSGAPAGSYALTVSGVSGTTTHTVAVTLIVTSPDFALAASPASVTITRGQTATYTVSVTPTGGFVNAVAFSLTGTPGAATSTFTPTSVAGSGSSTLRISTTGQSPRGTYSLKVSGSGGSRSHQVTLSLTLR